MDQQEDCVCDCVCGTTVLRVVSVMMREEEASHRVSLIWECIRPPPQKPCRLHRVSQFCTSDCSSPFEALS